MTLWGSSSINGPLDSRWFGTSYNVTGFVTKEYREGTKRALASGRSATTQLDAESSKYVGSDGHLTVTRTNSSGGKVIGRSTISARGKFWGLNSLVSPGSYTDRFAEANNRALSELLSKVADAHRDLPGLVTLGEIGESLRMIRDAAKGIRRGLSSYLLGIDKYARKVRKVPRIDATKFVADRWLEYAFGWSPLIKDVEDGSKALANALYYRPDRIYVKGFGGATWQTTDSAINSKTLGFVTVTRRRLTTRTLNSVKYTGVVSVASQDVRPISSAFGLTFKEFVPTVWELIPYSFLVDYFTNIGDIITGFSYCNSDFIWLCQSQKRSTEQYWNDCDLTLSSLGAGQQYETVTFEPGERGFIVREQMARRDYRGGALLPTISFTIPGMSKKWINMSALLLSSRKVQHRLFRVMY